MSIALVLAPPAAVRTSYVVDVGQPVTRWRWASVLLVPLELLAVAWSVGFVVLLLMVPIGLALAGFLWVGRALFRQ